MDRKVVRRGIAALAVTITLALTGAQPAAATDLGLIDRLAGVFAVAAERVGLWDTLVGWLGGTAAAKNETSEASWGSDPNGNDLVVDPTRPRAPGDSH